MGKKDTTAKPATPARRAAKPAAAASTANGAKKTAAPRPSAKAVAAPRRTPKTAPARTPAFTTDDVALRAYFVAEKRRQHGLPGDEHQDWIEAESQLLAESKAPRKSAR